MPRLLDTVDTARAQYHAGADTIEVIVSDNLSTDATRDIAQARGCRVASVERRNIAAVRNGGAKIANGDLLCFVDADMMIHPNSFNAIEKTMNTGKYIGGMTAFRQERLSFGLFVTMLIMRPRIWFSGLDMGAQFCRRAEYEAVGGYNETVLVLEDIVFLQDLRKLGRQRGKKLARVRSVPAVKSTRKWDEHGEWHHFRLVYLFVVQRFLSKRRAHDFVQRFWYSDERPTPDQLTSTVESAEPLKTNSPNSANPIGDLAFRSTTKSISRE